MFERFANCDGKAVQSLCEFLQDFESIWIGSQLEKGFELVSGNINFNIERI